MISFVVGMIVGANLMFLILGLLAMSNEDDKR